MSPNFSMTASVTDRLFMTAWMRSASDPPSPMSTGSSTLSAPASALGALAGVPGTTASCASYHFGAKNA